MWLLIIFILCAAVAVFFTLGRKKKAELPRETYVCDICGEKDCLCHKEENE